MRFRWFLILICWIVLATVQAQEDLQQHVSELRQEGMSESAKRSLTTVASIWAGAVLLTVEKLPSAEYESRFTTGFCPRPGADPEEVKALRQKLDERVQAELRRLKPFADRDGSGFISTEEASQFRELVLFGLRAAKLEPGDRQSPQAIASALGKDPGWVIEKARDYADLGQRVLASSSGLPESALPALSF